MDPLIAQQRHIIIERALQVVEMVEEAAGFPTENLRHRAARVIEVEMWLAVRRLREMMNPSGEQ